MPQMASFLRKEGLRSTFTPPRGGTENGGKIVQWSNVMKKIEAVIKPYTLDKLREALEAIGISGLTIYEVRGHGRQKGHTELYRGAEYTVDFIPKLKLEAIVPDDKEDQVIETITQTCNTGKIGDGKIFVSDMTKVVRIRTGELNESAL